MVGNEKSKRYFVLHTQPFFTIMIYCLFDTLLLNYQYMVRTSD